MTLVGFSNNFIFPIPIYLYFEIINTNVGEEKTVMIEINFLELKISSFFLIISEL